VATADRVISAAEAVEQFLRTTKAELSDAEVAAVLDRHIATIAGVKPKLANATPEQLTGAATVLQGIYSQTSEILARYALLAPETPEPKPKPPVAPPEPSGPPEPPEPVTEPNQSAVASIAANVAALAEVVNPPLSDARVQVVLNSAPPDVAATVRFFDSKGVFASMDLDKGERLVGIFTSTFPPEVGGPLADATLAVVQARIQKLLTALSREVIAPLSIVQETQEEANEAARTVSSIQQALALASQAGDESEVSVRHALRRTVLNPMMQLVKTLAVAAKAPLPTASMPMDVTAPEDEVRAETLNKEEVEGKAQGVGTPTDPPTAAPPTVMGYVLWVPFLTGDEHFALGAGGVTPDSAGFAPFDTQDAAKEYARTVVAATASMKYNAAPNGPQAEGWERRFRSFNYYRIEPYAPQLDPQAQDDARDEGLPAASSLVSMLDQFKLPDWWAPGSAPEPPEARDLLDYLDQQFGVYDWTDLLAEAVQLRAEIKVEADSVDRCLFWTRNPGSYTNSEGVVTTTDYEGTRRLDSTAVDGKTWFRCSMLCAESEAQIEHWQAVAPFMPDPQSGRTLSPHDFDKHRAAANAAGTDPAPITPDRTAGHFQITPHGVWIDSGLLSLLTPTTYTVEPSPTGVRIGAPDGSWTIRALEDSDHVLPSAVKPVYALAQEGPVVVGHELDRVLAFLADVESRGLAKPVPGSMTTADALTSQAQSNGGLTVSEIRGELIKVLTSDWLPWAADHFGVVFAPSVSMQPDAVVLNLLYSKDASDPEAPESYGITANFAPAGDEVSVELRLRLPENPTPRSVVEPLAKALDPLVLVPLLTQYQTLRPGTVGSGKLTKQAGVRVEVGRDRAYAKAILDIAETRISESLHRGARGESIE